VCPVERYRRQRKQNTCYCQLPRCIQGHRSRDFVQLVQRSEDVHEPWASGVQMLDNIGVAGPLKADIYRVYVDWSKRCVDFYIAILLHVGSGRLALYGVYKLII
jgi:hypothetical protein